MTPVAPRSSPPRTGSNSDAMKHLKYLRYLARHKWFVLVACFRRGLYWQGIVHDWSKFLPSEWLPYARFFYGDKLPAWRDISTGQRDAGYPYELTSDHLRAAFNRAWLAHQHRSPHHWQHWVLRNDDGTTVALPMPHHYVLEMLCDWEGAGRAITGQSGGTPAWYAKNRDKMLLHEQTRIIVDALLDYEDPQEAGK